MSNVLLGNLVLTALWVIQRQKMAKSAQRVALAAARARQEAELAAEVSRGTALLTQRPETGSQLNVQQVIHGADQPEVDIEAAGAQVEVVHPAENAAENAAVNVVEVRGVSALWAKDDVSN